MAIPLTLTEAADLVGRDYSHLYKACVRGDLPSWRMGSAFVVNRVDLMMFVRTVPYRRRKPQRAEVPEPVREAPEQLDVIGTSMELQRLWAVVQESHKLIAEIHKALMQ